MINKNDKLVIFLEEVLGVDVDFWSKRVVWSDEGALYSSPWKRNINYWMKCVIELLKKYKNSQAECLYYIDKFTF